MNFTATHAANATRSEPDEKLNALATQILDAAFLVHREMGIGLLESVYEECFCEALSRQNLQYQRQADVPVYFLDKKMGCGFRADLIIEHKILIEIKSVDKLIPAHEAQILNYLRLSRLQLGFLMNFNTKLLKDGLKRYVQTNP